VPRHVRVDIRNGNGPKTEPRISRTRVTARQIDRPVGDFIVRDTPAPRPRLLTTGGFLGRTVYGVVFRFVVRVNQGRVWVVGRVVVLN